MRFNGHLMTGGRNCIVLRDHVVEVWGMHSQKYKDIINSCKSTPIIKDNHNCKNLSGFQDGKQSPEFTLQQMFLGHTGKVCCASLSGDQYYLITGGADKVVRLWCLRMKVQLALYRGHTHTIWDVHFKPSGLYFLSGSADGLMALWRTDFSTPVRLLPHSSDVFKVSFAKNPSFALSGGDNHQIKIWNLETAEVIKVSFFLSRHSNIRTQYLISRLGIQDSICWSWRRMEG